MDDFAASEFRDYMIKGDTSFYADEMKAWGAVWNQDSRSWILYNTNEICSDYQAIIELGLDLLPIQENKIEKMVITQLTTRG